jgi:hypothetical protein
MLSKRMLAIAFAALAALCLLAAALWLAGYVQSPAQMKARSDKVAECQGKKDRDHMDLCYINAAFQLKDKSLCDTIPDKDRKELCIGRVGVSTKNPKLCNTISNATVRAECLYFALNDN